MSTQEQVELILSERGWTSLRDLADSIHGSAHGKNLGRYKSNIYAALKKLDIRRRDGMSPHTGGRCTEYNLKSR